MSEPEVKWLRNERTGEWQKVEVDGEIQRQNERVKQAAAWVQSRVRTRREVALILADFIRKTVDQALCPMSDEELADDINTFLLTFMGFPRSDHELGALLALYAGRIARRYDPRAADQEAGMREAAPEFVNQFIVKSPDYGPICQM